MDRLPKFSASGVERPVPSASPHSEIQQGPRLRIVPDQSLSGARRSQGLRLMKCRNVAIMLIDASEIPKSTQVYTREIADEWPTGVGTT